MTVRKVEGSNVGRVGPGTLTPPCRAGACLVWSDGLATCVPEALKKASALKNLFPESSLTKQ